MVAAQTTSSELSLALQACAAQQFEQAEHILRWGTLNNVAPPTLGPSGRWLRLTKAPKLLDGATNDDLASACAGLAASRTHFKVLVVQSGVYFSLGPTRAESWFRRVLAPRFIFVEEEPILARSSQAPATGLRLIAVPPVREEEQQSELHHNSEWVPLMERLFANRGAEWGVLMDFTPVTPNLIAQQLADVSTGLNTLALHRSIRTQQDEINTIDIENPTVARLIRQLSTHRSLLDRARLLGGWQARLYAVSDSPEQVAAVSASFGAPMRPSADSDWIASPIPVIGDGPGSAPSLEALGTLSSADLADLIAPPRSEVGRVRVSHPLPPGSPWSDNGIAKLNIANRLGIDDPADIDIEDLVGHGFICGMTGAGKSMTVLHLLLGLWNAHRIPFLIIDPVKADYERYAGLFRDGLTVIDARSLVMNVLEPWPGFESDMHIGMVANAFRGSFTMPTPIPYVLARLLEGVKEDMAGGFQPTLHDVRGDLTELVPRLGYAPEVESNVRAALGTRLDLLLDPFRAERVAGTANTMLHDALTKPTVVQLSGIADEDERAFIMSMLATYIAQAARIRGPVDGLAHVTVLEEAHRIMPEPRPNADPESGDAKSNAAEQLASLLAEIRSYGESVLVLDQSPAAVARNVVRNTNLKILHRVADPDDRSVAGGSVGLDEHEARCLVELEPGQAIFSSRRVPEPQTVQLKLPPVERQLEPVTAKPTPRTCCDEPLKHHKAEHHADTIEVWLQLELVSKLIDPTTPHRPTNQLEQFAAAHNLAVTCVWEVGLRRLARCYGSALNLDLSNLLAKSESGTDRLAALADSVRPTLVKLAGPYESCQTCPHPCTARLFVNRGLGGRTRKLAYMTPEAASGSKLGEYLEAWLRLNRPNLARLAGDEAARVLSHCAIVHRMATSGVGTNIARRHLPQQLKNNDPK